MLKNKKAKICLIALLIAIVIFPGFNCILYLTAIHAFQRMLSGNNVKLSCVKWHGKNKIVVIQDPELLNYFSKCFKFSTPYERDGGASGAQSSEIELFFSPWQRFPLDWLEQWYAVPVCYYCVWWQVDEWQYYSHTLVFQEPIPPKMRDVFEFLKPVEEVQDETRTVFLTIDRMFR